MASEAEKLKRKYALAIVRLINKISNEHEGLVFEPDFGYDWNLTLSLKDKWHTHIGVPEADNDELAGLKAILEALSYIEEEFKDEAKPYNSKAARTLYRKK